MKDILRESCHVPAHYPKTLFLIIAQSIADQENEYGSDTNTKFREIGSEVLGSNTQTPSFIRIFFVFIMFLAFTEGISV